MDYKSSGVDIDAGHETVRRIKPLARATFTPGVLSDLGSFGGLFGLRRQGLGTRCWSRARMASARSSRSPFSRRPRHRRRGSRQPLRQRYPRAGRAAAVLPRLSRHRQALAGCGSRVVRAWPGRAGRTAARCSAARPPRCPASTSRGEYDLAGFIVGAVDPERRLTGAAWLRAICSWGCRRAGCTPTAIRWRGDRVRRLGLEVSSQVAALGRRSATRSCAHTALTCR